MLVHMAVVAAAAFASPLASRGTLRRTTGISVRGSCEHQITHFSSRNRVSRSRQLLSLRNHHRRPTLESRAAISFSAADIEDLRLRYEAADIDGDSYLNAEELRGVLECTDTFCLDRHWLPMEQVHSILATYDVEGKGKIGFEQFINLAGDQQLLEGKLEEYLEAFSGMDKDGSGFIDVQEMTAYFQTLDSSPSQDEIESMFDQGDLNDDRMIDFAEFLGLLRSKALDLQGVLKYLEMPPVETTPVAEKKVELPKSGVVTMIHGKSEMDYIRTNLNKPVILMIAFHWCRPCKGFARKYERFADGFKEVTFLKVYGEENEDTKALVQSLSVKSSPAFYLFDKAGDLVANFKGANEERFRTEILQFLNNKTAAEAKM